MANWRSQSYSHWDVSHHYLVSSRAASSGLCHLCHWPSEKLSALLGRDHVLGFLFRLRQRVGISRSVDSIIPELRAT